MAAGGNALRRAITRGTLNHAIGGADTEAQSRDTGGMSNGPPVIGS
jgi:hypothetical protein